MKKIIIFFIAAFILFFRNADAYIAHFLKIKPDARVAAMGGAGTAGPGLSSFSNPAKGALIDTYSLILSHISWIENSQLNYAEVNFKLPANYGFIGLSAFSMYSDKIERRKIDILDPLKILPPSGEASAGSLNAGFSYSNVFDYDFFYGLKNNMLRAKNDNFSDKKFFFDAGLIKNISENFSLGISAKNLFGKMSFTNSINEKVCGEYRFGTFFNSQLFNTILNFDVVKYSGDDVFFQAGIEYSPFDIFKLRAGWQSNYESGMRLSLGAGFKIGFSQIDFSYQDLNDLEKTFRLSAFIKSAGKNKKKIKTGVAFSGDMQEFSTNENIPQKEFEPVVPPAAKIKEISAQLSASDNNSMTDLILALSENNKEADILAELGKDNEFKQKFMELSYLKFLETPLIDQTDNYTDIKLKWNSFENSAPEKFVVYSGDLNSRIIIDYQKNEIKIDKLIDKSETGDIEKLKSDLKRFYNTNVPPQLISDLYKQIEKTGLSENADIFEQIKLKIVSGASKPAAQIIIPLDKNSAEIRKNKYETLVMKMSKSFGVNPDLVDSIIRIESSYNQYARGNDGEIGLMQITPGSAGAAVTRELFGNVKFVSDELYDPEVNIFYGTAYLNIIQNKYLKKFKDLSELKKLLFTVTAYNAGLKYVNRFSEKYNIKSLSDDSFKELLLDNIPNTTVNYISKVMKFMKIASAR